MTEENKRLIQCTKLGEELAGLESPPFPGDLGQEIYSQISQQAWDMWKDLEMKIINEYRLNLGKKEDHEKLLDQMRAFLQLAGGEVEVVEVENPERGKGE